MSSYHIYCLASPIDFVGGSIDYWAIPEVLKPDADRLLALLERNPLDDSEWREDARFGWVPMPDSDLRLWAFRKLDANGTTVVVSPLALGYTEQDLIAKRTVHTWA